MIYENALVFVKADFFTSLNYAVVSCFQLRFIFCKRSSKWSICFSASMSGVRHSIDVVYESFLPADEFFVTPCEQSL